MCNPCVASRLAGASSFTSGVADPTADQHECSAAGASRPQHPRESRRRREPCRARAPADTDTASSSAAPAPANAVASDADTPPACDAPVRPRARQALLVAAESARLTHQLQRTGEAGHAPPAARPRLLPLLALRQLP